MIKHFLGITAAGKHVWLGTERNLEEDDPEEGVTGTLGRSPVQIDTNR
jgi:hypothetical protein